MISKKGKKENKNNESKLSRKQTLAIAAIAIIVVSSVSIISFELIKTSPTFFSMKAVIVDQLALDSPNDTFVNTVTQMLDQSSFNVSYARENADVSFFSRLAIDSYGIIILRTHTAMREDQKTVDIFTSEEYVNSLHTSEQARGWIVEGIINNTTPQRNYFAITSDFIKNIDGDFPKSIIFMMGCWSLKSEYEQVAQAFVSKGATVCTGWSDLILPGDTDAETARLIGRMLDGSTVKDAVRDRYSTYQGNTGPIKSYLGYYPLTEGDLRLSDLVNEAKNSAAFEVLVQNVFIFSKDRMGLRVS
jgi:hypothetical protein